MSKTKPEEQHAHEQPAPKRRRKLSPKALGSIAILAVLALLAAAPLLYLTQPGERGDQAATPVPAPEPTPVEPEPEIALPQPEIEQPMTPEPDPKPVPQVPDEVARPTLPDPTNRPDPEVAVSGWNTLLTGTSEADGYGLYSYLLIPVNDEVSRPRYLATINALRRHIDPVAAVETAGFKKYEINITYLPLRSALPQDADAELLLDRYDFARSKRLLGYVAEEIGAGPYLVSYLGPLSGRPPLGSKLLVQDLSWVPPELAALWISNFTSGVKTPRSWDQTSLNDVMLVSRTFISVAAQALDTGVEAIERFISLKEALAGQ